MNSDTGYIYNAAQMEKIRRQEHYLKDLQEKFIPMEIPPTKTQLLRSPPRVGRNEKCPCGSGKKFKQCCLRR